MTHDSSLLINLLSKCKTAKKQGHSFLLVFDLDSTLFDVSPRIQQILREFALLPETQKKYSLQAPQIEKININRYLWGIQDALASINITSPEPLLKDAYEYWLQCFFHEDYLIYDTPVEGAVHYLQTLQQYADVFYLTGRDVERMGKGTAEQLQRHSLPLIGNNRNLILKPQKSMNDAEFKLAFFQETLERQQYQEIWFFDNDPRNLHIVSKKAPQINQVYFKSAHPPEVMPPKDLPQILHFLLDN